MYWDLNVSYPANKSDQRRIIEIAMELGYDGIVFSETIREKFNSKNRNAMTPIDLTELSTPPLRQSSTLRLTASLSTPFNPTSNALNPRLRSAFQQKFRLNLELSDVSALPAATNSLTSWDIVAARASNESMFHSLCSFDCIDLIIIDSASKLGFHLKRPSINLALQNGLHFELFYSSAIKDSNSRRYLFAAAQSLTRVCPARAIIFSSGCESISGSEIRSPYDGINILRLMGLNDREARDAISANPERALWHGETRRTMKAALRAVKEKSDDRSAKRQKHENETVDEENKPIIVDNK